MPRIDPLSLLKCLSVLLGPNGGIKSKEEVGRLANLMTKFSKKLVSKCIYIQILKSTNSDLLSQFMGAGGWNLIHMWLTDGILAKNWALIQELLELLLLCPVDIERLKSNNCPKLIKGLSKEGSHQGVRTLASRLVEKWLKMVKGEAAPTAPSIMPVPSIQSPIQNSITQLSSINTNIPNTSVPSQNIDSEKAVTVQSSDSLISQNSAAQPIQIQEQTKISSSKPHSHTSILDKSQSMSTPVSTPSVYRITIRDGKQVLTQVQTDAVNIAKSANNINNDEVNSDFVNKVLPTEDEKQQSEEKSEEVVDGKMLVDQKSTIEEVSKCNSSEVIENDISSKDINEMNIVKSKDHKTEKDINSDSNKSTSDKENRDKKDDKKSSGSSSASSDKKSSSHSSSSRPSSKHNSSSSKHSSSSHRSSSHRSSSKSSNSSSSRDKSSKDKDKEKDRHHSSSSSKSSNSKSKTDRDKEKEKLRKDQAEKDKATLEKLQSQTLSTKMGKIPKKKADEEKPSDSPSRKSSTDSKDSFKENKDKIESKKVTAVPEKKNISISIENRKNSQDQGSRPKTVKTFNSKFRSTGLEEEVKPPPPRNAKKLVTVPDKKILPPKLPLKRSSPISETSASSDKKAKLSLDSPITPPSDEKKGGIKLIPAKPKLVFLQESDMFMDALTASTKSKEPRKRKRRTSISKDGPSDSKKSDTGNNENNVSSPPSSPTSPPSQSGTSKDADDKSLLALKPTFKFYQDTLETDEEKDDKNKVKTEDEFSKGTENNSEDTKKVKKENKDEDEEDDDERSRTPTPEGDFEDMKSSDSPEDPAAAVSEALKKEEQATLDTRPIGVLKSVLLLQKRKGPKKSLKWKTDLESIRYFELDETERVNVTKTFTDMKQMEKQNEREAFQMARKLSTEDLMEEKTIWKALIPIDVPPPLVKPGKDSREKDIQYAREKGILQALYFNRSMIPDSPAEPDEERHHIYIEPKVIPLDDLTGNKDSEKDFTNVPWPEPKPQLPTPSTIMQNSYFQTFRPNQQQQQPPQLMPPMGTQPPMAPMPQQIINTMPPMPTDMQNTMPPTNTGGGGGGGGGWRTGDGKIVVPDPSMPGPMPNMPNNYPQNMEGGPMVPPNMMGPPMYNQDGYMMGPDEMGYNNYQGPPGPGMYGPPGPGGPAPPGGPPGPPFQGPRGPPMHGNRGRGGPPGPGWFRGGPPRGMPWRGGWRGSGKQPPVCRQFSKNGYCRVGDKCQYLHPGVNCPPF